MAIEIILSCYTFKLVKELYILDKNVNSLNHKIMKVGLPAKIAL